MVGVEFVVPGGRTPDKKKAKAIQKYCLDEGLILLTCGIDDKVIRWIPPLVIDENHLPYQNSQNRGQTMPQNRGQTMPT